MALGYASTIHGAQGVTAETCHGLITGRESRQQLYTMLSRGREANHAYVQVTGDGDPRTRFHPDTVTPPTATERLEAILARDDAPASATTQLAEQRDPRTLLGAAAACYQDALIVAAEQCAGTDLLRALDKAAEATGLGVADAEAWPVLRSHLAVIHANGYDPFSALRDAAGEDGVDHRLDVLGLREAPEGRPLPWLPGIPAELQEDGQWSSYLDARRDLVTQLANHVHHDATRDNTIPAWATSLVRPPSADVIADITVWRAVLGVPETDLRPTGPVRHRLAEARVQHKLDALIAGESEAVVTWVEWIHQAAPDTVEDPGTIRVARECAEVDPTGAWLREHVQDQAGRPLPDDHKADALRFRLESWLHPVWETVTPRQPSDRRR